MLMASLLLSLAGDAALPGAAYTVRVFPESNERLPRNARPIAFTSGGDDLAFVLHRGDALETVPATVVDVAPTLGAPNVDARLLAFPILDADEAVILEPSCCGEAFSWTVGAERDDVAPAFVDDDYTTYVTGSRQVVLATSSSWEIQVILPALVADEATAYRLVGDLEGYGVTGTIDPGVHSIDLYVDNADNAYPEESDICFDVVAIDVAGNESAPLPVCVPLIDRDKGCAQASSSSFGLLGLALLLVRRRRC